LTPLGYRVMIEEISAGDKVVALNDNYARPTEVLLTLNRNDSTLYNIKTMAGFELSSSADHPLLTREGMRETRELSEDEEVAIHPFNGVEYEEPEKFEIVSGNSFRDSIKKELKKRDLLPLTSQNERLTHLVRIFGYLLGDGTVYDKYSVFYGEREDLESIKEGLRFLGYSGRIYEREREYCIKGNKFSRRETSLKVSARSLVELLWALSYPQGDKTEADIQIPQWISRSPKWMKRLFLASYFGAEMSKPKTMNGYNFYMPEVKLSRRKGKEADGREFLGKLQEMLEEFGVSSTISKAEETEDKVIYRLLVKENPENLLRLWGTIGYEYNRRRRSLAMAAIVFLRLKQGVIQKREALREKIGNERGKLATKDILRKYGGIVNKRFIERSLYGHTQKARPPAEYIKFEEFVDESTEGEIVYDKIAEIQKTKHNDRVYDLTVKNKHHNFVANGFVVSNCGVRLLYTDLEKSDVEPKIQQLVETLFRNVPSGLGSKGKVRLTSPQLDEVLENGVRWAVENGFGWKEDLERLEAGGCLAGADASKVSSRAKERGLPQLGSLGSGNHFLEVQFVNKIFDPDVARTFGITHEGQVTVMIHTGSRGLGHQVCSDYLRTMERAAKQYKIELPDRELVNVPISSPEGQSYFSAMACAANYGFTNRQMILHWVRESFENIFGQDAEKLGLHLVYGLAHNIAKFEEHEVDGERKRVCVHRKGATRAFPPGHPEIPAKYREVGQPVLIPGDMGTASYVLVGTERGAEETFSSTAHGSGRHMSRTAARKRFWGGDVAKELKSRGIYVRAAKGSVIAEEAPGAYKSVDAVAKVSHDAGIARMVARLVPMGVAKG